MIACAVKGSFLFPLHLGDERKQRSKLKKHHPRLGRRGAHGLRVIFLHLLGPKLFFVTGLVIFATAVASLVSPDLLG